MSSQSRLSFVVAGLFAASQALAAPTPPAPGTINTTPASLPTAFVPPPDVPADPGKPALELTTLKLLLAKGAITQDEYDTALKDSAASATSPTVTIAGWKTTLYGWAQLDGAFDTTQAFSDANFNTAVPKQNTYAGSNSRFQLSIRNSRFGFRVAAPALGSVKMSANLEFDLGGGVGNGAVGTPGAVSEAGFFVNPTLRVRQAWGKVETPIVDVLFGQTWTLFGGLPTFTPTSVNTPGITGEIYGRTPQLRVSKTIKTEFLAVEIAVAAARPAQRDSWLPDGQALVKISFPKWTAWHTGAINGTGLAPASVAASGVVRSLTVGAPCTTAAAATAATTCPAVSGAFATNTVNGLGLAVDAFIPVIPGSKDTRSNSLSLVGEFATGTSISDTYSALTGGVGAFNSRLRANTASATGFAANGSIDNGLLLYSADGSKLLQPSWTTFYVGLEYYLPGGQVAAFLNWGHSQMNNAAEIATAQGAAGLRNHANAYQVGVFADLTPSVRIGADYTRIVDAYQDGVEAVNNGVHASAFLFF